MKVEIQGTLLRNGFVHMSDVGLHLFVNCVDRNTYLDAYCVDDGEITFFFTNDDNEDSQIVFRCETEEEKEKELLKDTQRFDCVCKEQWEFLFIKFNKMCKD